MDHMDSRQSFCSLPRPAASVQVWRHAELAPSARWRRCLIDGLMKLLSLWSVGWINVALPLMAAPKSLLSETAKPRGTTHTHRYTHATHTLTLHKHTLTRTHSIGLIRQISTSKCWCSLKKDGEFPSPQVSQSWIKYLKLSDVSVTLYIKCELPWM